MRHSGGLRDRSGRLRHRLCRDTQKHDSSKYPRENGIAVLPFRNLMGDPEQEYFVDGVVEEITATIAIIPGFSSSRPSFRYKGKPVDVRHTARELGVRYVLEGSVRKVANWVRITAELSDTATGSGATGSTASSTTSSACRTWWRATSPARSSPDCASPK
jgi:TolB-like protein